MRHNSTKGSVTALPAAAAIGLDLFAAAWVERFTANGGSLIVNPDGSGGTYLPADCEDVPGYCPPPTDLPEAVRERRRVFDDAAFIGRTRELLDLLEIVPGGREAVRAHVRAFPSIAYAGGIVGVA